MCAVQNIQKKWNTNYSQFSQNIWPFSRRNCFFFHTSNLEEILVTGSPIFTKKKKRVLFTILFFSITAPNTMYRFWNTVFLLFFNVGRAIIWYYWVFSGALLASGQCSLDTDNISRQITAFKTSDPTFCNVLFQWLRLPNVCIRHT